jgi:cystathionine gamma-lyase/methionine-gamma-lyase
MGVEVRRFDQSKLEDLENLVDYNTAIVYVESMANPNLVLSKSKQSKITRRAERF